MSSLDEQLKLARRQVLQSRRIVAAQRLRVAAEEAPSEEARLLLASFEQSLVMFEREWERLLTLRERI